MITMIKSRWLLYRDVHCIMMQVFFIFENINNKLLGKKAHDLPIGPKPAPPPDFSVPENGTKVYSVEDTYELLVQHCFSRITPLSAFHMAHNDILC